jgi:hypothetical protein
MLPPRETTIAVSALGSVSVLLSYYSVFSGESQSYTRSRFWLGLSEENVKAVIPLQVASAIGFLVFLVSAIAHPPRQGILSYLDGYGTPVILAAFFASSTAWTFLTKAHLDRPHACSWIGPSAALIVAAISAVLLTAGVFEDDSSPPHRVLGALAFATVVTLVDAVGWNSRLILSA